MRSTQLPTASERLIGAACTLGTNEMRERLRAWRDVRDGALSIAPIPGGASVAFGPDQPMSAIAELMTLESECCPFYTFTLQVDGPMRQLEISAGAGGEPAVTALLGLDEVGGPGFGSRRAEPGAGDERRGRAHAPRADLQFEPADGGTKFSRRVQIKVSGWMNIMQPMMGMMIPKQNKGFIANLKRALDREPRSA
jgi:hypothetical protein